MGYIDCPECGREVDNICCDYDWSLGEREPTEEDLLEYLKDAKCWTEKERTCGCGHVWTPNFLGTLIDNNQQHTRIYLSHAPGYFKELLKQDCPLSNWMREETSMED